MVMAWHMVDDEVRWLLSTDQLSVFLAERGLFLPVGLPVAAEYRGAPLFCPKQALAFCETPPGMTRQGPELTQDGDFTSRGYKGAGRLAGL
jgi:hypothetical protein